MKLRPRLVLAGLVASIPVVVAVAWSRSRFEHDAAQRGLVEFINDRMLTGAREDCERAPEIFPLPPRQARGRPGPWPGPPRGRDPEQPSGPIGGGMDGGPQGPEGGLPRNELWAYASDFRSANPRAPEFPAELKAPLEDGASVASAAWDTQAGNGIVVAMKMEWNTGPCAIVIARRAQIGPPGAVRDSLIGSLVVCFSLLGAVAFAAGPIVERVRRLTVQVRQSADKRYATPADVQGSDEITELAGAFNSAAREVRANVEALEQREKTLRGFVENTTHDVMIPLTVLQGHLTALRRKAEAGTPADRDVVVDALQEAHYMASLIQNLSVVAQLEDGELQLEKRPFDLCALVERCVARHAPIAKARGIALEHAVPPSALSIAGDLTLVEQLVSNLIHNAVRYVEPSGHVAVVLEQREGEFALRVLDDGPGIPDELRERVFERSFRADAARSRVPGGNGLGLSIAKNVADRHGFTLTLRRPEPGGLEAELRGPRVVSAAH